MRSMIRNATVAASVLVLAGVALAQGDWYQHRDERFRGEAWRAHMFAEIKEDVDHVQATAFAGRRDEYQLARAKQELDELQQDLGSHRYEEAKLDEVIGTLQRVANDNRLPARDRDILNDDLHRLRDYREHHEHWG
jgi:hypothetical protein